MLVLQLAILIRDRVPGRSVLVSLRSTLSELEEAAADERWRFGPCLLESPG